MPMNPQDFERRLMRALQTNNLKEADMLFTRLVMDHPNFRRLDRSTQEQLLLEASRYFRYEIQRYNGRYTFDRNFFNRIRQIMIDIYNAVDDIRMRRYRPPYGTYDPIYDRLFGVFTFTGYIDYDDYADYFDYSDGIYFDYNDYADYGDGGGYGDYGDYGDYSDYADYADYADYGDGGGYGDYSDYSDYSDYNDY